MELDADIGKVMDEIRKDAPNTIVIVTADNGAWLDAYPDAGTTPFRGEKGSPFEGGWRVPGIMWWPGHIPARAKYDEMMSHIDAWATLAGHGRPDASAARMGRQRRQADLFRLASTTAPTSSARSSIRRAGRGSISTARLSRARGPTSAAIPRSPGSISPGSISTPPRTPGWVRRPTWARSARPTT